MDATPLEPVPATTLSPALLAAGKRIVSIPDYPEPGVIFRDIMPLLADGTTFRAVCDALVAPFVGGFDAVAAVEARGFPLGGAVAALHGIGLMPIRKPGKLPRPAASASYSLEYGSDAIEAQADLPEGSRVLIMDDVLATGGTLGAAAEVVRDLGYTPVGIAVLMELPALNGRSKLPADVPFHALFQG